MYRPLVRSAGIRGFCLCTLATLLSVAQGDPLPPTPGSGLNSTASAIPANAPTWFAAAYRHALGAGLQAAIFPGTAPEFIPQMTEFLDPAGLLSTYQPSGPTKTAGNAFFQPLGTNGRTCFTCHQTPNAMGMSAAHARAVFVTTRGLDPLFAPVDGANCPNQVTRDDISGADAHSLLLNKGLFRIFLPVPAQAEFTIELVSDPNGCNSDPAYNQVIDPKTGAVTRIISVYRRPLMAANLKFKTNTLADFGAFPPIDFANGQPLPIDPFTGQFESLNIMWDGREPTLQSQASDATLIHSQATSAPTSDQIAQIVAFENGIFSAQERLGPVYLSQGGANGGAVYLSGQSPLQTVSPAPSFAIFDAWSNLSATSAPTELEASIARGQTIFDTFPFNFNLGAGAGSGCASCHGQPGGGENADPAAQRNIGVGGQSAQLNGPAPDPSLPIFRLVCTVGARTGVDGPVVTTNDPGLALITGKCADIGGFTVPSIRGLSARAPYFHDGSAATILDIVNFYDRRFSIGFTAQQKQDLVNFLNAL